jgi:hypothetical protein
MAVPVLEVASGGFMACDAVVVKIKLICFVVDREYNPSPPLGPNRIENLDERV